MKQYKDIINYSIIYRLKQKISDACIIFNNLVNKKNIDRRESDKYEIYTLQYTQDLKNLQELRDRCQHIADECNKIMLDMNTYHIKQYYIDREEIKDFRDKDNFVEQFPTENEILSEEDEW